MKIRIEKSEPKNEKIEGYNPKMFRQMKFVYTLLSIINLIVVIVSFALLGFPLYHAQQSSFCISKIEENILETNNSVLMMVVDVNNTATEIEKIEGWFDEIAQKRDEFNNIGTPDADVKSCIDQAYIAIDSYKTILKQCASQYEVATVNEEALQQFQEQILPLYKTKLEPSMRNAANLMSEAVEVQNNATTEIFFARAQSFLIVIVLFILILVLGLVSIRMMDRNTKRNALELQKRASEIEKTTEKLTKSRDKTREIAYTNVLTGLKNRYALEEETEKRLEKESFYISNFDFDNFRSFNEMYGRNMGDAFLATVAEQLRKDYSEYAEIYNITSDEFTFVFKSSVSGAQATNLTQRIYETMSKYYTIENITVQVTVSGCTYHYLAGEFLDMNAVLSKMDSVMHQAKSNGGKTILEVR